MKCQHLTPQVFDYGIIHVTSSSKDESLQAYAIMPRYGESLENLFVKSPEKLSDKLAREIYGAEADEAFEPQVTSTELKTKNNLKEMLKKEFATA